MSVIQQVSGLASGLDWSSIITQLRALEEKNIDVIRNQEKTEQDRLSTWQSINSKLLSLKTAADALNTTDAFNLYSNSLSSNTTTDAKDILSVSTTADAAPGTYQIKVTSLAAAQKISSTSYASQSTALNLSGDIIIGGRTVKISSTDTLGGIRDKINAVNTGTNASKVTASIVNYGTSGYRLILTSDKEGSAGISLLNGGSINLIGTMGFVDTSALTAKNVLAGGNESDALSAADKAVGGSDLLNLTSPQSGSVSITINGTTQSVAINLATDSLNSIRDSINTAFGATVASVVSSTDDTGNTTYRLLIEGNNNTYTDTNNILETLGILKRAGVSDERGVTGDVANTSGGVAITSSTLIKNIDGYNDYASGDTITLSGTSTSGGAVSSVFTITDTTTVGDLLTEIQTRYGSVSASVTADGKIRVVDNEIGDTDLVVTLTPNKSTLKVDTDNNLGTISTIRARQIQAGANANITVDGVSMTPSSNTVTDVITGVTLNLKKAAADTTVTLSVSPDTAAVKDKIAAFVKAYNDTMSATNAQLTYDADKKQPGGPLFGDSTLRMLRSSLANIILTKVSGVSSNFATFGMVGISLDKNGKLTTDDSKLQGFLQTNFNDVKKLFAADWSATNSNLVYLRHSVDTHAGTYNINITGTNPVAGYFVNPGDASGSGEYLTGTSGNAKDLLVRYSGTTTGGVGSLTLTFGVAELFDRSLYQVTDSVNGYLANKTKAIQDTIANYEKDINTRETRLNDKMDQLESQFIAMESVLGQLQSQSSWLTGQINAASRGWK